MTATSSRANARNTKKAKGAGSWARAKKRNGGAQIGSKGDPISDIERFIAAKRWSKARSLAQEALVSSPTDHWLWMMLSLAYYESRRYEKALECAKRAVELQANCPLALWHYAGSLFMSGHESSALVIWTLLLDMDLEDVAYGECGEGMDAALQLINDVHYRVGRYYQWKGDRENACVSFRKYLHNRAHGVGSIYDAEQVKRYLRQLAPEPAAVS